MEERQKNEETQVRVSRLAITALILGLLCLVCAIVSKILVPVRSHVVIPPASLYWTQLFYHSSLIAGMAGLMLGIISMVTIERSGGRVVGRKIAVTSIVIPVFVWAVMFYMVAFARVRCRAFSMICGTNLSGLGRAMMLYANDYQDELPKAGGKINTWVHRLPDWTGGTTKALPGGIRFTAYGMANAESPGKVTLSSSLYLLIKHAECTPKMFICTGEKVTKEFNLRLYRESKKEQHLECLWDFGPEPWRHYNYSYHMPFGAYALTTSAETGTAVLADRNPWIAWPGGEPNDFAQFKPDIDPWKGTAEEAKQGNTHTHQRDGQNVLFIDSHVDFEKRSFCGIDNDNIYTRWDGEDKIRGMPPDMTTQPADRKDSLLVHDPPVKR